jgi:hypothetical protein
MALLKINLRRRPQRRLMINPMTESLAITKLPRKLMTNPTINLTVRLTIP